MRNRFALLRKKETSPLPTSTTTTLNALPPNSTNPTTPTADPVEILLLLPNMSSESGEIEVEAVSGYQVLPKDVVAEIGSIKLFNKWSYEDVEIRDISLTYVLDHLSADEILFWQGHRMDMDLKERQNECSAEALVFTDSRLGEDHALCGIGHSVPATPRGQETANMEDQSNG